MSSRSEQLQEKIEKLMTEVPPVPKGFENWIRKSAFKNNKYIFYKKVGSKVHGLCSACGEKVEASKAKHNEAGRCPACRAKITFRAINKAKSYEDTTIVSIMQKMSDGKYVIRYFKAHLKFKECSDDTSNFPDEILGKLSDPIMTYWEGSREILKIQNGVTLYEQYEELWNYNKSQCEWRKEHKRSVFFNKELLRDSNPFLYKKNLKGIVKNTKWKYSGLDHLKQNYMNISDYIYTWERYPAIEMLSKLNYQTLLNQIIHRTTKWGGTAGILKMDEKRLGLSKNVLNRAIRLELEVEGIEFISTLEELGKNLTDEQIIWALENTHTETFTEILKWISPQKLINYVEKNTDPVTKRGFTSSSADKNHFVTTWRDYLQQCEKLELDTKSNFVLFPRNLQEKHEEYTKLIKLKKSKILDQGIKVQYDKWNELLSYQAGNLKIEVAESHKLILEEGQTLRHCVGGSRYSENMAEGKNLILFLRKNNKPYYTIEFNTEKMKVIQNRGLKNKSPSKEVEKFINKWKIKKLLSLKEMKQAI
jgi:DNA-directed RNA polymerase subunit RPC12/RpoP